jgi:hypothetical protein
MDCNLDHQLKVNDIVITKHHIEHISALTFSIIPLHIEHLVPYR